VSVEEASPTARGVQAVITGGYWLKPLTANRLAVILFLPTATATANRLGGGDYFYNRRLAVITGGLKPLLNSDFGQGLDRFWARFKPVLGRFLYRF
jgi:hypothetical protein